ncbi:hypothetical protein PM082_015500 [Marasmius tenuissimus]|nr:hypothetical protein PM082_015500 [Marasmius tenuissimus]
MGIASTLIIVRSVLGITINDEKSYRETVLGENDWQGGAHGMVRMANSVIDIRRRDGLVASMGASDEEHPMCVACRNKQKDLTQ